MNYTLCNWSWRPAGDKTWTQCKHDQPTTEIFPDLLDAGVIPNPFVDLNEKKVQWVGERDWQYRAVFDWDAKECDPLKHCIMRLEGLDTYVDVELNGTHILRSSNAFHVNEIDIKKHLVQGQNEVILTFDSPLRMAKEEEARHTVNQLWNGDSSRLYARKPQYHFGWDWGPVILTCGPFRPIHIMCYDSKILDVHVSSDVKEDLSADLTLEVDIVTVEAQKVVIVLRDPLGRQVYADKVDVPANVEKHELRVKLHYHSPHLWYPIGYGDPAQYTISVHFEDDETNLFERKFGIRRVRLVQDPLQDQSGTSFFFEINNVPIFMNGTNWIPAHSYLTRITEDDYHQWVSLAAKGNQNMLRVWGGGIFEHEAFYNACDEEGIVVWQDFLFGCGQYPYYKWYKEQVERECHDQLLRLRNHCSIIIYVGNNEDYQIAESCNLQWDPKDHSGHYEKTNFPARQFYEVDLPNVLRKFLPSSIYHRGSPYGGSHTADPKVGDLHQWNLWHGTQERYQDSVKLSGRFISEFGMLSLPSRAILESCTSNPSDLHPQSEVVEFHTKADMFVRRLSLYVMENVRVHSMDDIDEWIYATQLVQAECNSFAYKCWRRNWKGKGKEYTGGILSWQLNDCWPGSSWAVCDFNKTPKLAYYGIKRESQPITLAMLRTEVSSAPPSGQKVTWLQDLSYSYDLWGVNATLTEEYYDIDVRTFDIVSGKLIKSEVTRSFKLASNSSTDIVTKVPVAKTEVVQAILLDKTGQVVARASDWPQPLKYLQFPDRDIDLIVFKDSVKISVKAPVKGLELMCKEKPSVLFDDNGIDVFPNDDYTVICKGVEPGDKVSYRFYH